MARFGEIGVICPHQLSGLWRQLNRTPPGLGSYAGVILVVKCTVGGGREGGLVGKRLSMIARALGHYSAGSTRDMDAR